MSVQRRRRESLPLQIWPPRDKRTITRALQELSSTQHIDIHEQSDVLNAPPLQDIFRAQALVLTGLIAHLTGAELQEDIALTSRRLQ